MYDRYWNSLIDSIWAPETYFKVLLIVLTYPLWSPIAKVVWQEIRDGLAPDGTLWKKNTRQAPRHAPGMDPFTNVPLARHRRSQASESSSNAVLTPAARQSTPARGSSAQGRPSGASPRQGHLLGRVPARRRGFQ